MRARRLCEKKMSGRCNVPDDIRQDYVAGGQQREVLELALLDAIQKHGVSRTAYKKVKAEEVPKWLYIHACKYINLNAQFGTDGTVSVLLENITVPPCRVSSWHVCKWCERKWKRPPVKHMDVGWQKSAWRNALTSTCPRSRSIPSKHSVTSSLRPSRGAICMLNIYMEKVVSNSN